MAKSGAAIGQGLRREGRPGWRSSHPPHLRRPCAGAPPRPRWCDPVLSPAKDLFASAGKCVLCELMRYRWCESVAPSLQCVRGVSPHLPLAFCVARAPERRALATPRVRSVTAGRSRSVHTVGFHRAHARRGSTGVYVVASRLSLRPCWLLTCCCWQILFSRIAIPMPGSRIVSRLA